jgi:tetratricopeptide (TPR) repeat protein
MRAILARGSQPALTQLIENAVAKGDTVQALELLTKASNDPLNRFRSPETDVNALGYRLLPAKPPVALAVFKLNARAFPKSANVWDSLGEALLANGDRDAAIASYKKAVELNPDHASAVQALHRLGAM